MDLSKPYIQGLMLYDFTCGLRAADLACHINSVFGQDKVSEYTAQDWLAQSTGDHDLEDRPTSGSPSALGDEHLRHLVRNDRQ